MKPNYVVRLTFWGDSRKPSKRDLATFRDKKDALEYEKAIQAEIELARHAGDALAIEALSIGACSELIIQRVCRISYEDRKWLLGE